MSKYFKINNIQLSGTIIGGEIHIMEQMILDHEISVPSGVVIKKQGDEITIMYETLKKNIHNDDITPTIEFNSTKDFSKEQAIDLNDYIRLKTRDINDEEYTAINEYNKRLELKADRYFNPLEDGDIEEIETQKFTEHEYEDIARHELSVVDVTEDYKVLIHNFTFVNLWSDGTKTIDWGTERYALKYGIIYPYNSNQDSDDVDVDLSGLSDILN
jgi:hypothetical protein